MKVMTVSTTVMTVLSIPLPFRPSVEAFPAISESSMLSAVLLTIISFTFRHNPSARSQVLKTSENTLSPSDDHDSGWKGWLEGEDAALVIQPEHAQGERDQVEKPHLHSS